MTNKMRLALIVAEIAAIATIRAVYLIRKERDVLPRSSKVKAVRGRPVFGSSWARRFVKSTDRGPSPAEPQDVGKRSIAVGGVEIPVEDPDQPGYDAPSG